jgi:hypothetical protein
LRTLKRRGYEYDASTFPSFLGPLARAYYFMTTKLTPAEKVQRKQLFGKASEGLRPLKPYRWQLAEGSLVEIPVTTMPVFKVPIHISYLLYLAAFSPALAVRYFQLSLALCRLTGAQPSILLHPLDFLGADDNQPELAFFPAMGQPAAKKLQIISDALAHLSKNFQVVSMEKHARAAAAAPLPLCKTDSLPSAA